MSGPKIAVVGCPGAGKSTVAALISRRLGVPHIELDALAQGPGWRVRSEREFRPALVERLEASEGWVTCGNYEALSGGLHFERADHILWMNPSRSICALRVFRRSLRRSLFREELWNGNRERIRSLFSCDLESNILLWTWTQHPVYAESYRKRLLDDRWREFSTREALETWLEDF